jgi:lysophospholipase L1-like esterase
VRRMSVLVVALLTLVGFASGAQAGTAVPPALPAAMAAAGDSITRGYDVTPFGCFLRDCPAYSWSTGTNSTVRSQYSRISAAQPGVPVTAANVASTGAKMADLDRQLTLVGAAVPYATVLLGANDVCTSSLATMTPTATFRGSFDTALQHFFDTHPQSYVFVSSIPNVYQLWSTLQGNASARSTWKAFGICQSMLSSTNTETTRQAVLAQERTYNSALAEVCAAYDRCRWDGGAIFGVSFAPGDVSRVDYFHPSAAGQAKLAAVTWAAGYWPTR